MPPHRSHTQVHDRLSPNTCSMDIASLPIKVEPQDPTEDPTVRLIPGGNCKGGVSVIYIL